MHQTGVLLRAMLRWYPMKIGPSSLPATRGSSDRESYRQLGPTLPMNHSRQSPLTAPSELSIITAEELNAVTRESAW